MNIPQHTLRGPQRAQGLTQTELSMVMLRQPNVADAVLCCRVRCDSQRDAEYSDPAAAKSFRSKLRLASNTKTR
jgi:hypothetical protein